MTDKAQADSKDQVSGAAPSVVVRDWFVAAIECDGTVSDSLNAVLRELERRGDFIKALRRNLEITGARGIDAITDVGQRIKALENTLRFRLGILRPERPAAWFRAPAATTTGPFSRTVLEEPVFNQYELHELALVKAGIESAWQQRTTKHLPFRDQRPCLWRTLLGFAELLERIAVLPEPFVGLRLDRLPDGLPAELESRALRAFLLNVRNELLSARDRLDTCYRQLHEASERLWAAQGAAAQQSAHQANQRRERVRPNSAADSVREEFKRRRSTPLVRRLLTPADIESLKFMGFDDLPSAADLRQRYLMMARQLHPDLQGGSEQKFKSLTRAYEHLSERMSQP